MEKYLKAGLLFSLMLLGSCSESSDSDDDIDVDVEEVELANPMGLNSSLLSQRDALLTMHNGSGNWTVDLGLTDWDGVSVDTGGNVISFSQDGNLGAQPITEFNRNIGDLIFLDSLISTNTDLQDIPTAVGDLSSLRTLILNSNSLVSIPSSLGDLSLLSILDLSNNLLVSIPSGLADLALTDEDNTVEVNTGDDDDDDDDENVVTVPTKTTLNLLNNSTLTSIPDEICSAVAAGELIIFKDDTSICDVIVTDFSNDLTIEDQIAALLEMYNGSSNWDVDLDISEWKGIILDTDSDMQNVIGIEQNGSTGVQPITDFDENLGVLIYLESLTSINTNLTSLPEEIGDLRSLTRLTVSNNSLTSIPSSIGSLPLLNTLNILNNPDLLSIPSEICDMEDLGRLTILKSDGVTCN